MAIVAAMINMKGGVGKSTLTFNLAWHAAWRKNLKVLAVDLDPQANLSQYFLGAKKYLQLLNSGSKTVVDIFEQFSPAHVSTNITSILQPDDVIFSLNEWRDNSLLHLVL